MGRIYKRATSIAVYIGTRDILRPFRRSYNTLTIQALDELEQTPYFNRLWIKQEIILAEEVNLFCGTQMRKWQELEQMMDMASEQRRGPNPNDETPVMGASNEVKPHSQPKLAALCEHRKSKSGEKSRSENKGSALLQLLARYGESKCVDARDKVYGLLSLLPEDDIAFRYITVDYGQSAWALLCQIHAMCCHDQSEEVRSQSLLSLSQVAHCVNVNPRNPEVAQFLHGRLRPHLESQISKFVASDTFVELSIKEVFYLQDIDESGKQRKGGREIITFQYRALTSTMSAAEAMSHHNRYFQLPRTEALSSLQNQRFKQILSRFGFSPGKGMRARLRNQELDRFLVSSDTLQGDLIARVDWKNAVWDEQSTENTVSWAVLRPKDFPPIFNLLCWAIPADTNLLGTIDTRTKEPFPVYSPTTRPSGLAGSRDNSHHWNGTLNLHHDNALSFVAIAREGLQALTVPTTQSHASFLTGTLGYFWI